MTIETPAPGAPQEPDNAATSKSPPWRAVAIGAALFAVVVWAVLSGASEDDGGGESGAEVVCEDFVKDRLKSPSSAEFSDAVTTESASDGSWTVRGIVDSENGFGAMLRNSYTCTVRFAGGDRWTLDSLDTSGN